MRNFFLIKHHPRGLKEVYEKNLHQKCDLPDTRTIVQTLSNVKCRVVFWFFPLHCWSLTTYYATNTSGYPISLDIPTKFLYASFSLRLSAHAYPEGSETRYGGIRRFPEKMLPLPRCFPQFPRPLGGDRVRVRGGRLEKAKTLTPALSQRAREPGQLPCTRNMVLPGRSGAPTKSA